MLLEKTGAGTVILIPCPLAAEIFFAESALVAVVKLADESLSSEVDSHPGTVKSTIAQASAITAIFLNFSSV